MRGHLSLLAETINSNLCKVPPCEFEEFVSKSYSNDNQLYLFNHNLR